MGDRGRNRTKGAHNPSDPLQEWFVKTAREVEVCCRPSIGCPSAVLRYQYYFAGCAVRFLRAVCEEDHKQVQAQEAAVAAKVALVADVSGVWMQLRRCGIPIELLRLIRSHLGGIHYALRAGRAPSQTTAWVDVK